MGIGTTSPSQKLDVSGIVKANYFEGDGSKLANLPTNSSYSLSAADDNPANVVYVDHSGFVGIGKTTPGYKFDVEGDVNIEGAYKNEGHTVLLSSGTNCFVGKDAGKNQGSGGANVFLGSYSGMNAGDGHHNVYLGCNAGLSATGDYNIFFGYQAGENETGSNKLYIANSETDTPLIYGEFDNNLVAVNGTVKTREVIVENTAWPDYVLKDDYRSMPLDELERNIKKNGHLPDIPSAEEVKKNGVSLGEMQAEGKVIS